MEQPEQELLGTEPFITALPPARRRSVRDRLRGKFKLRNAFTALKYPNYRLWFWGQMVSLFGTWMQSTAQGFLVYQLTHSPAYLGYVGFATGIPAWLFMLYAGVIADRVSRRGLMVASQSAMMVLALTLAVLTFTGVVQPWHIIGLSFLLGTANAFDAPARLSLINELVEKEDLTNAIALNATMFNVATAIGPAAAGVVYALIGPAWCFTLNGISFIAVIVALVAMKLKPAIAREEQRSRIIELREGVAYAFQQPVIRAVLLTVTVVSVFGVSLVTLFPAWAVTVLHGDATTNGLLQSARGIGAFVAALGIASLGRFSFKGRLLTFGVIASPLLAAAFSLSHWLPLSLLMLVGLGGTFILIFNIANAIVQTTVPDRLRGRVMGVYSLVFFGFMPVGALFVGTLAAEVGEQATVLTGAGVLLVFGVGLSRWAPRLRRHP